METRDIFENMASRYDNDERIKIADIIADAMRKELEGIQGGRAMDYGCGTGLVGLELMDCFERMLFVDNSKNMVEQVEIKLEQMGAANAETLCSDYNDLPDDLDIDYVIISQVLLHIRDVPALLAQLHRVLNKKGHLIIVDFDKNENVQSDKIHKGFEQAALKLMLEQAGFSSINSYTFHHGERLLMNTDASLFIMHAMRMN